MADLSPKSARYLRRAIGAALVQSGWMDRDDPDEADLLQFQNCDGCQDRCPCAGVPFLSSLVWDQIDKFGDLSKAFAAHEAKLREQLAQQIEAARTDRRDAAEDAFLTWRDGMEEASEIVRGGTAGGGRDGS